MNIGLKSFITDLKKTLSKLYDCEQLENMKTSFLVQKIFEKFQLKIKAENC